MKSQFKLVDCVLLLYLWLYFDRYLIKNFPLSFRYQELQVYFPEKCIALDTACIFTDNINVFQYRTLLVPDWLASNSSIPNLECFLTEWPLISHAVSKELRNNKE